MLMKALLAASSFAFLLPSARAADGNFLEIYLATSNRAIDWSSPRSLFLSYIPGQIEAEHARKYNLHPMGHTLGHFSCTDTRGEAHDEYTALTGQNIGKVDTDNLLNQHYGLAALFLSYDDGNIEPSREVRGLLASYKGRLEPAVEDGKEKELPIKFLRFPIATAAECDAIVAYHQAFYGISHEQPDVETSRMTPNAEQESALLARPGAPELPDPHKLWFGLNDKPYDLYRVWQANGGARAGNPAFLSGGCSSYMTGFLKVIGLYEPEFDDQWVRSITMRNRLVADTSHGVSPDAVIGTVQGGSWQPAVDAHDPAIQTYFLSFWDPQKMWDFIDTVGACAAERSGDRSIPHFHACRGPAAAWFATRANAPREEALDLRAAGIATNHLSCDKNGANCLPARPIYGVDLR